MNTNQRLYLDLIVLWYYNTLKALLFRSDFFG